VIALTVALTVVANVGLALTRQAAVAVALLAVVGIAAVAFNVVSVTYRQSVVPDRLLGRVSGAYRFATWGINPVGAALGGVVAAAYGIPAVFYGAAAVLAAAGALTLPALTDRRLAASLAASE
jgi:predicted MFS family arabinose efflux permease